MYAEERQQAMAQLVAEHGRLSVNELAEQYDVTTETVRRDLSALERIGPGPPGARRRGPAQLPRASSSPGSASATRPTPPRRTGSPRPRSTCSRRPASTVLIDAGSTTSRLASLLPRDHRLDRRHPRRTRRRPAGRQPADRAAPAARPGPRRPPRPRSAPRPSRARPTCAPTSRSSAPTGITVEHGLSTPDRDEAATKRAMVARRAPGRRPRRLQQGRRRDADPVRARSPRSTSSSPTTGSPPPTAARSSEAGLEVVVA